MRAALILVACLALSCPTIAVADVVSEEHLIASADTSFADNHHTGAKIATHADTALVAWLDARDFGDGAKLVRTELVHLSDGSFEPPSITLGEDRSTRTALHAVLWAGQHYLVFYSDDTTPMAARIDASGHLLDQRPTSVVGAVATDGTAILSVAVINGHLFATPVSALGTPLELPGQRVVTDTALAVRGLVHDGQSFVVFFADSRDGEGALHALRLQPDGTPMGSQSTLAVPQTAVAASQGVDGTLLAWTTPDEPWELQATRFGTDDVLGAVHVLDASGDGASVSPVVAPIQDGYVVAYGFGQARHAIAVDASGAPSGTPSDVPDVERNDLFSLAGDERALLAVGGSSRFSVVRYAESGELLEADGLFLARGATRDSDASVAFAGTGFLVAWARAPRNPARDSIRVARVELDGAAGEHREIGAGHQVSLAPVVGGVVATWDDPAAFGGAVDGGDPVRRNLDANGEPLDDQFGHRATPPYLLASDGTAYVVAWTDEGTLNFQATPRGTVVSSAVVGELRGLVWTGSEYVVLLDDGGLTFVRTDATGALLDPTAHRISSGSASDVSIAAGGGVVLASWVDGGVQHSVFEVDGTIVASDTVSDAGESYRDTAATFDGTDFVIAFGRGEAGDGQDIGAIRVSTTGVSSDAFDVSATDLAERSPAIASDGAGRTLVVYTRLTEEGTARIHARFVRASSAGETGSPCVAAADCTSGFCVDGMCCDGECGGGAPDDCQACSARAGGRADGLCSALRAGVACRSAAQGCDAVDVCNGVDLSCPDDLGLPQGAPCEDDDPCTVDTICQADDACVGSTVTCDSGAACDPELCCGSFTARCQTASSVCAPLQHCAPTSSCEAPVFESCEPSPEPGLPDADDTHDVADDTDDADASPSVDVDGSGDAEPASDVDTAGDGDDGCGCAVARPARSGGQRLAASLFVIVVLVGVRRRRGV